MRILFNDLIPRHKRYPDCIRVAIDTNENETEEEESVEEESIPCRNITVGVLWNGTAFVPTVFMAFREKEET